LSAIWYVEHSLPMKILLFLSFQIFHTVAYHINRIMDWRALEQLPPTKPNWLIKSAGTLGTTEQTPSHRWIKCQTSLKKLQCKNKWGAVSNEPHPPTHKLSAEAMTPRRIKLSLVDNLSRNKRQAKRTTFRGISLCHRSWKETVVAEWCWWIRTL